MPFFQLGHSILVEVSCRVDASANLVDIGCCTTDGGSEFFLLRIIHLDDVPINRHLAKVSSHVLCAELCHLRLDDSLLIIGDTEENLDWPFSVCHRQPSFRKAEGLGCSQQAISDLGQGSQNWKIAVCIYTGCACYSLVSYSPEVSPVKYPFTLQRTFFCRFRGWQRKKMPEGIFSSTIFTYRSSQNRLLSISMMSSSGIFFPSVRIIIRSYSSMRFSFPVTER